MMKLGMATVGVLAAVGAAPMQCGHGGESGVAREESPGDALFDLAQDFHAHGNEDASKQTLRFLVTKYPSNRHAPAARATLDGSPDARAQIDAGP